MGCDASSHCAVEIAELREQLAAAERERDEARGDVAEAAKKMKIFAAACSMAAEKLRLYHLQAARAEKAEAELRETQMAFEESVRNWQSRAEQAERERDEARISDGLRCAQVNDALAENRRLETERNEYQQEAADESVWKNAALARAEKAEAEATAKDAEIARLRILESSQNEMRRACAECRSYFGAQQCDCKLGPCSGACRVRDHLRIENAELHRALELSQEALDACIASENAKDAEIARLTKELGQARFEMHEATAGMDFAMLGREEQVAELGRLRRLLGEWVFECVCPAGDCQRCRRTRAALAPKGVEAKPDNGVCKTCGGGGFVGESNYGGVCGECAGQGRTGPPAAAEAKPCGCPEGWNCIACLAAEAKPAGGYGWSHLCDLPAGPCACGATHAPAEAKGCICPPNAVTSWGDCPKCGGGR